MCFALCSFSVNAENFLDQILVDRFLKASVKVN